MRITYWQALKELVQKQRILKNKNTNKLSANTNIYMCIYSDRVKDRDREVTRENKKRIEIERERERETERARERETERHVIYICICIYTSQYLYIYAYVCIHINPYKKHNSKAYNQCHVTRWHAAFLH